MADVFISYAREDHAAAARVADLLEARGRSVWWDRDLVPGESFDEVIEEELTAAKAVVVLWSGVSVQSRWVRSEANAAVERGNLIPVTLDGTAVPLRYRIVQAVDLAGWDHSDTDPRFTSLCAGVESLVGEAHSSGSSPPRPLRWADPTPMPALGIAAGSAAGPPDSAGSRPEDPAARAPGPPSGSSTAHPTPPDVHVVPAPDPGGRRRPTALLIGLAALAVAATGVAVGVVLASGSDDGRSSVGSPPSGAETPSPTSAPDSGSSSELAPVEPTTTPSTSATVTSTSIVGNSPPAVEIRELAQGPPAIVPYCVGADGSESSGKPVTFDPSNLIDGQPATAWRCDGNLTGTELIFAVPGSATITALGLSPGYAKIDPDRADLDRFFQNRRITAVTWTCRAAGREVQQIPQQLDPGNRLVQQIQLPQPVSCDTMSLRIDGVTEPGGNGAEPRDYTAISEVSIRGWTS